MALVEMVDKRIQQIQNDLANINTRKVELEAELVKLQIDKQDYDVLVIAKIELEKLQPMIDPKPN